MTPTNDSKGMPLRNSKNPPNGSKQPIQNVTKPSPPPAPPAPKK